MEISVDGRIMIDRWPDPDLAEREFEALHRKTAAKAWLCGRVTMRYFAGAERTATKRLPQTQQRNRAGSSDIHVAAGMAKSYAVAVDPSGRLLWKRNDIGGDHVIVILTRRVPASHLAFLRERGISYLIAGNDHIDFPAALAKLKSRFGINRLAVEGGGTINASLLHAGLIDELSLLLFPVADGRSDTKSLFETPSPVPGLKAKSLTLLSVRRRPGGVLWLRYRVRK
jgi:riboflavin biosynthesis pyrimidine reductase